MRADDPYQAVQATHRAVHSASASTLCTRPVEGSVTYQVGGMRASGAGIPESYITPWERYRGAVHPAFSGAFLAGDRGLRRAGTRPECLQNTDSVTDHSWGSMRSQPLLDTNRVCLLPCDVRALTHLPRPPPKYRSGLWGKWKPHRPLRRGNKKARNYKNDCNPKALASGKR